VLDALAVAGGGGCWLGALGDAAAPGPPRPRLLDMTNVIFLNWPLSLATQRLLSIRPFCETPTSSDDSSTFSGESDLSWQQEDDDDVARYLIDGLFV